MVSVYSGKLDRDWKLPVCPIFSKDPENACVKRQIRNERTTATMLDHEKTSPSSSSCQTKRARRKLTGIETSKFNVERSRKKTQ